MTATRGRIWAALLVVYVVWGSTYLAIRYAIGADTGSRGLPPLLMGAGRFAIAGALVLAWALRRPHRDGQPDPIGRPQLLGAAFVGLALLLGGNGLVVLSEQRVSSGVAAVVVALVPVWVAGIGAVVERRRLPRVAVIGLVLGLLGVVVLADPGGDVDPLGALMVTGASLSWSIGSFWSHRLALPRRPLVSTGLQMLFGSAGMLVVGLAAGEGGDLELAEVGTSAWIGAGYLVVFGSILAFSCYAWLLQSAPLGLVTTYAYVNPIVAVGLGALPPLREPLTARVLVASAVVVTGVCLVVRSQTRRSGAEAAPPVDAVLPVDDEPTRAAQPAGR